MAHVDRVLLICSSCGKESSDGNTSKNLQKRVQKVANAQNDEILVLLTSCLGVCPEFGTTIGYSSGNAKGIITEVISDELSEDLIIKKL